MQKEVIVRRLRPLYLAAFFQGFVMWYAIEKLFMSHIGFTAQTVALETILFTIVMLIANVPLGVLADRWSRKGVLAIASTALIVGTAICGASSGFWAYTIGISFWGLFYAAYAGTYDSVIYDLLLEETKSVRKFEHYYGRIQIFDSLALVLSSLLCTAVTHFVSLRAAYFLTIPFTALSLLALQRFREPQLHRKEAAPQLMSHLGETLRAVLRRGEVFWIVLTLICLSIVLRIVLEFDQLWFVALALPVALYGPVNALTLSSVGSSGFIAKRVVNSRAAIFGTAVVAAASTFSLLSHVTLLIVVSDLLLLAGLMTLNIILSRYLHDTMPSRIRAGASSMATTFGYIAFLPVALLFGFISNHSGVFRGAWAIIVPACALLGCLAVTLSLRRAVPKTGNGQQLTDVVP